MDSSEEKVSSATSGVDSLASQLALLGLRAADVPWQLAAEFDGRYGAAFVLAPLLLALSDAEYRNVFELPAMLSAARDASLATSKRSSIERLYHWATPPDDDKPAVPPANTGDDGLGDDQLGVDDDLGDEHDRKAVEQVRRDAAQLQQNESEQFDGDDDRRSKAESEMERSRPVGLNSLYRFGLIQLTCALLQNGEISADRLSLYYPWCVRYFQAKHIRYRRAAKKLLISGDAVPLLPELARAVAEYV